MSRAAPAITTTTGPITSSSAPTGKMIKNNVLKHWALSLTPNINCRGHLDVPPLIPMDATTVYLDGNNMSELVNPGFIGELP